MAIQIDVIVVVIDRGDESGAFIPFVGMLVGSCFNKAVREANCFFKKKRRKENP